MSVLRIILFIMDSVQQQIRFNGNVFGKNVVVLTRVTVSTVIFSHVRVK